MKRRNYHRYHRNYHRYRYNRYYRLYQKVNALQKKRLADYSMQKMTECILFLVLGVCLLFLYQMLVFPRINLEGNRVVEVEYQGKYKEPGYASSYFGKNLSSMVEVEGEVDTSKVGEYPITYQVNYHGFSTTKTRIVKVVDSSYPEITFTTDDKKLYLCPDSKYLYDDYQAFDNYDGDITDKVKVTESGGRLKYVVSDTFGNKTVVKRDVLYKDILGPTIELDSGDVVTLSIGDTFTDSTYQVSDNCDKNIKVEVHGDVDTSQPGIYERVYKATDSSSNTTEKVQKVMVFEPSKQGVIYLTFDDGPRSGTTDIILNILKEENVKATFFVTNSGPDDLIKRAYDEGHAIGLHTASHDYSVVYASGDSYFNDLKLVSERVKRITGEESKLIRFPGGSSNTISRKYSPGIMSYLTQEVVKRGYRYYDWNIDSRDAEGGRFNADEITKFVTSKLSHDKVNMVLMHDIKVTTMEALRNIIRYGKENGYVFDKIGPYTDMVMQHVNN